ncbi:MAG: ATP:cob(I)alamin adenosyltransferase [Cytophagales bacterium]|nr:ATP:cob(I)alamin adenosyltransferase [Cytophagales bacterium]
MAQRITAKTFGTGAQGFTVAHRTVEGKDVLVRKDDISCEAYGLIDSVNAWLGRVKNYNQSVRLCCELQQAMLNLGSMIFSTLYATYEDNTALTIKHLERRLQEIDPLLNPTEFILYGVDTVHADWCILNTEIRKAESKFVGWVYSQRLSVEDMQKYAQQIDLLNTASKWAYSEARYYAMTTQQKEETWLPNHKGDK